MSFIISCNKEKDTTPLNYAKTEKFVLVGAGFVGIYGPFEELYDKREALNTVAQKWGMVLENHGCVITNDSIMKYNRINWDSEHRLKKRYGSNWLDRFKDEVLAEDEKLKKNANKHSQK